MTASSTDSRLADDSRRAFILLMEDAYTAKDKETYYKLMQNADQVLKDIHVTVDIIDTEAA